MIERNRKPFGRPLPSPLDEIADVAGLDAAMMISEARGGGRLEVAAESRMLSDILGDADLARAIGEKLGVKRRVYIPLADYHLAHWLEAKGATRAEIVRRTRVSGRTLQRWKSPKEEQEQLSLKLID